MKKLCLISYMAMLLTGLLFASAQSSVPQDPSQVVRESVDIALSTIEELKKRHGKDKEVTDEMVEAVIDVLEPVVDFQSFTTSVMGKHAKQATAQQKQEFRQVFVDSLVRFYMKSLLTFEIQGVKVFDQEPDFDPSKGRATVRVEATDADNKTYQVRYTMRTDKNGEWKVRNFLIEGINVGLTFLNQFDGAMAAHNNDINMVIANWSAEIDPKKEESKQ